MIRLIIAILLMFNLALPAIAADTPVHDITITPGQPWQMVVKFISAPGVPVQQHGLSYLAFVGKGAPLSDGLLARMYVEQSNLDPTAVLLRLTAEQTTKLARTTARWSLVYIPDLGTALLLTTGKVVTAR